MTKKEAIALEALCEKRIAEKLNEFNKVTVTLNLAGRLRIERETSSWCFGKTFELEYFNFYGDYSLFLDELKDIKKVLNAYAADFKLLIWSYENCDKLTGYGK